MYYLTATGAAGGCIASKNNGANTSGETLRGWFATTTAANKIAFYAYTSGGVRANAGSVVFTTGWHWLSYEWNVSAITVSLDRLDGTPVSHTTFGPDQSNPLTFGKYAYTNAVYFTGSLALAGFYSRYPALSERMRSALYVKGLMAMRGVTLA